MKSWQTGVFFELKKRGSGHSNKLCSQSRVKKYQLSFKLTIFNKRIRRTGSKIQNILNRYLVLVDYTKLWIRFLCLCTAQLMKNSDPSLKNTGHTCFLKKPALQYKIITDTNKNNIRKKGTKVQKVRIRKFH